jgi:hypothetical protein
MYEYLPIELGRKGDVVECIKNSTSFTSGELYVLREAVGHYCRVVLYDKECTENGLSKDYFKLVKTKPGSEAKVGDTVIRTEVKSRYDYFNEHILGNVETVNATYTNDVLLSVGNIYVHKDDFQVLCKAEDKLATECEVDDELTVAYVHSSNLCREIVLPNTTQKEETMSKQEIEIKVNGTTVGLTEPKPTKVKTDLESRSKFTGILYSIDGAYESTHYANKESKLIKLLQDPSNIGKTLIVHKAISTHTTKVPVVSTKE